MNIFTKLGMLGIFFAIVLSVAQVVSARAQDVPIEPPQLERIQTNCLSAIATLNQLHASDALLRVNRGQLYESMSTKLMDKFNARAIRNNYTITNLTTVATDYKHTLDTFRMDYRGYEEQLSAALRIDCTKQPAEFYDAVAAARTKRIQVHTDITQLDTLIDQYRAAFDNFEMNYRQAIQGITR